MPADAMLQFAPASLPTLDHAVIARYRQRRATLLLTLVDAFLVEGRRYFQELQQSLAAMDRNGVRMAAHGLKSSSLNMGATRLAQLCLQIEQAAMTAETTSLATAIATVEAALGETEQALVSLRAEVASHPVAAIALTAGAR